jgi:predicted Zn-dependent peptidase
VQLSAEAGPNRDPGLFQILARVRKSEDLAYVRQRIKEALGEAAKSPIEAARLSATKSYLRYDFAGSMDSADAVAEAVGTAVAVTGRPESINELFEAYDRLAPSDLQRVAAQYFQANNETAVILETEIKK